MRDLWNTVVLLVHAALTDRRRAPARLVGPVTRNDGSRIWHSQISP